MIDFGVSILIACAVYVALLLTIGFLGRRAQTDRSLSDFYLAGRSLGSFVLLLTLFATQYSGNSLSGFPGQTYREGLSYYMSVTFMTAIVATYLFFAPKLFSVSQREQLVTPTDYLDLRFGSRAIHYLSATIFAIVLVNFLLAQLMAMGHAFSGLTNGRIPYAAGVIGGAVVILAYELLGGMRAVAWTDALQGLLLIVGLMLVVLVVLSIVGGPGQVMAQVAATAPEKVAPPSWQTCRIWLSSMLLIGLGAPLYPQAIQRIYAARRLRDLKRALAVMAFLPHVAITTVVAIGVVGISLFPGLEGEAADEITFRVLAYLVEAEPLAYVPVLIVMMAVVAAIMSTADSCLLSLSSVLTKDVVARLRGLDAKGAEKLTGIGSALSIATMAILAVVALQPLTTLWNLLVIKFEILIQLSPAFLLGTMHARDEPRAFSSRDVLTGMLLGLAVALTLYFMGLRLWHGVHAGVIGLAVNYLAVVVSRAVRLRG